MAIKFGKKKSKQHYVLYTVITAVLLSIVFFVMVSYLYNKAETEAYENLHVQTKQIKDDIILQLTSDRENLETMANFAAKLYSDGDDYSLLFESFKPIGMIENIGILSADNTFSTKAGTSDMTGVLSFEEEKEKGVYISGKIVDVTRSDYELIRSAVPIKVGHETVGILYGAIMPEKLGKRYADMVAELDAQLFVYEKDSGDILIDTVQDEYKNISFLENRKYTSGYSYEEFRTNDKGFTSFKSAYKNETLHIHYSTIDEFGWMIAMGRYDSEVLASTHARALVFTLVYIIMLGIIVAYILILLANERKVSSVTECASDVRRVLLETAGSSNNIHNALVEICSFAKARSALFFDTSGELYYHISPEYEEKMLGENERRYFKTEIFRYASEVHNNNNNNNAVVILCIKPNRHLMQTNPKFASFLNEHGIDEVSLSATINKTNHITVLAAINSKNSEAVRMLAEKVSACFSMALYNKNYLNQTLVTATTDALTGVLNRVAYKNDLKDLDSESVSNFACIYVDVNELHLCNNKYGHAAGDEMLLYIANTLKEVFFGHKIYRMGGDEFLVFCRDISQDEIKKGIEFLHKQINSRNYHVAVGVSYRSYNTNTEDMVKEAEVRMYEAKAEYYQNKEDPDPSTQGSREYIQIKTGILEIDTLISVLKDKYNGIYRVSLSNDKARRILMPAYLNYNENEDNFSNLYAKYVEDAVDPDYHRAVLSFMNYDAIRSRLLEGKVPKITYKKRDGETVVLSVHLLGDEGDDVTDVLCVFAKE